MLRQYPVRLLARLFYMLGDKNEQENRHADDEYDSEQRQEPNPATE